MTGAEHELSAAILIIGLLVAAASVVRVLSRFTRVPALVGYLLLGMGLKVVDDGGRLLTPIALEVLSFLAGAGIIALLFRVGIESRPHELARQLPNAGLAWFGSVFPSGLLGFLVTYTVFGYGLVPSLFVAVALSATSVGVALGSWREAGMLDTRQGALLLDLAELDDLSGIFLMALVLAVASALALGNGMPWIAILAAAGGLVLKFTAFGAFCLAFGRLVAGRLAAWAEAMEPEPHPALLVAGIGFAIAALAGWLGLSLAIGALMAGLAFANVPRRDEVDQVLTPLFDFFSPFFFIGIGLQVDITALEGGLVVSLGILAAGVIGKVLGTAAALIHREGTPDALLIGVSMVPRAEIALVIMEHGRWFGPAAVPNELFAAVVIVSAITCLLTPIAVERMLRRLRPGTNADSSE